MRKRRVSGTLGPPAPNGYQPPLEISMPSQSRTTTMSAPANALAANSEVSRKTADRTRHRLAVIRISLCLDIGRALRLSYQKIAVCSFVQSAVQCVTHLCQSRKHRNPAQLRGRHAQFRAERLVEVTVTRVSEGLSHGAEIRAAVNDVIHGS